MRAPGRPRRPPTAGSWPRSSRRRPGTSRLPSRPGSGGNSPSVMTCWPAAAPSATARNCSARSDPATRASSSGSTPLVTSSEGPRSAMGIQLLAIERCSDLAEPLCAQLASIRELVASIPAPRRDHRQHEDPALAQQVLIDTRIVVADFFGRMGEVEFDRPAATRLEVYEQQPVLRGEHVARVRLTVQQLLSGAAVADHPSQAPQRVAEEVPVRIGECRSAVAARDELLSLLDSVREVRRRDIELGHAGMQTLKRTGVVLGL